MISAIKENADGIAESSHKNQTHKLRTAALNQKN